MVSELAVPATAHAEEARISAIRADLYGGIRMCLDTFSNDCGRYPTTSEGLKALFNCPTNIPSGRWHGPYFDPPKIPQDVWKHDYVYRCPGTHHTNSYDIYSCGFDGISKSGGDDLDDINNWDPSSPHGGNDGYLNNRQMLLSKIQDSLEFHAFILILQVVPILFGVRLIAAIFSQRVRTSVAQHPTAHIIWLALSLAAVFLFLSSIPRIAGR